MGFTTPAPVAFGAVPRPAFGRLAQHHPAKPMKGKALARYQREARNAAALLPDLPAPGESIHALMTGHYDLAQVITTTVARLAQCLHLRIATLCFSKRNAAELLSLLDTRKRLRLTLLVSVFHREHNKELHEWFRSELRDAAPRRATLAAARSHAKVVCFDEPGGLTFEGSANLRTNGNREQLTAIRDRVLHDWHAAWIDELVSADHAAEEEET